MGRWEEGRVGGRKGGWEGGREEGREEGREGGRVGGWKGGRVEGWEDVWCMGKFRVFRVIPHPPLHSPTVLDEDHANQEQEVPSVVQGGSVHYQKVSSLSLEFNCLNKCREIVLSVSAGVRSMRGSTLWMDSLGPSSLTLLPLLRR